MLPASAASKAEGFSLVNPLARYVHVRPRGIVQWMTPRPNARQPDQCLFRFLLRQPPLSTPVCVKSLSQGTGLSRGQVARSLFSLYRHGSIRVTIAPPAEPRKPEHPAAEIHRQLNRLCTDTAAAAVLADPDGLCMASHGMAHEAVQSVAAGFAPFQHGMVPALPLYIGQRPCRLHTTSSLLFTHEALVGLVRSLHDLIQPC